MKRNQEQIEKQFDALIAQLPKQRSRRKIRALPWLIGMIMALVVIVVVARQRNHSNARQEAIQFPLAVCGNGQIEPSENCELDEPDCPSDCVRRAESSDSTTPK